MLGITLQILSIAISAAACVLYVPVIVTAIRRREGQESAAILLAIYAAIALVLQVVITLWEAELLHTEYWVYRQAEFLGMLCLALLLTQVVRSFLRREGGEVWLVVGIIWVIVVVVLQTNILKLPDIIWENENAFIPRYNLAPGLLVFGWVFFTIVAVVTFYQSYRTTKQPLYRNRYSYFAPIFLLLIANDILFMLHAPAWTSILRLTGTGLMGYVIVTHDVLDVRDISRRSLIYFITTAFVVFVYIAGTYVTQFVFAEARGFNPLVVSGIIAVVLAAVFTPLLGLVRRLVDRIFGAENYNASQTLRDYSLSVSNIIEMDRLASVAVSLIMDLLGISRGYLFLVDKENQASGETNYRLRPAQVSGDSTTPLGYLVGLSPITQYLLKEEKPLLQYDIDLLPAYQKAPVEERNWLSVLNSEVYVPIYSKREWIGMFAFGEKLNGTRYTPDDLVVLSTLSQQTAVALENARLVDNLVRLNKQIRQAYLDLDRANRNLEKIDRTKSDFISIASHELRTPLTVMRGYAGMLLDAPVITEDEYLLKMVKGINDSTERMHEIMESMFDIVQIDNRTMQMHMQEISVSSIVKGVVKQNSKLLKEREQTLANDLPELPKIKADPNLLDKVFQHVIGNAIKFTPNGGTVSITGRVVPYGAREFPDGGIEVVVTDTGVGIDPQNRELIFTKFYQSSDLNKHSTGKSKFKGAGAGLGLALSKGIVEAHGGRIWVESQGYDEEKMPGSQFHIAFPINSSDKKQNTRPVERFQ